MNPDTNPPSDAPGSAESEPSPAAEGDSTDGSDRRSSTLGRACGRVIDNFLNATTPDQVRDAIALIVSTTFLVRKGHSGLFLLFALPHSLPAQLSMSGVGGLPKLVEHRCVPHDRLVFLMDIALSWLAWADHLVRSRWFWLVNYIADRVYGALWLLPTGALALLIPFGNMLPALAISPTYLGILEQVGLRTMIGKVSELVSHLFVASVDCAVVKSTTFLILNSFG